MREKGDCNSYCTMTVMVVAVLRMVMVMHDGHVGFRPEI